MDTAKTIRTIDAAIMAMQSVKRQLLEQAGEVAIEAKPDYSDIVGDWNHPEQLSGFCRVKDDGSVWWFNGTALYPARYLTVEKVRDCIKSGQLVPNTNYDGFWNWPEQRTGCVEVKGDKERHVLANGERGEWKDARWSLRCIKAGRLAPNRWPIPADPAPEPEAVGRDEARIHRTLVADFLLRRGDWAAWLPINCFSMRPAHHLEEFTPDDPPVLRARDFPFPKGNPIRHYNFPDAAPIPDDADEGGNPRPAYDGWWEGERRIAQIQGAITRNTSRGLWRWGRWRKVLHPELIENHEFRRLSDDEMAERYPELYAARNERPDPEA